MYTDVARCLQDLAQLQEAAQCLIGFRESHEIDPEAFSRLVYVARSVAAFRPTNLVLFAEKYFASAASGELSSSCYSDHSANSACSPFSLPGLITVNVCNFVHLSSLLMSLEHHLRTLSVHHPLVCVRICRHFSN